MKTIWSFDPGKASRRWVAVFLAILISAPLHAGDPTPAITAIAALTDPAKLATLKGNRAANDRLHKVLAYLEEARRAGMVSSKTIDEAQKITHDAPAHAAIVKEMLLRNMEICERGAVFTDDNLARMKRGYSPLVTSGTFIGQPYEVDHIIPVHEYPALENELANLIYLPRTQNRRKSDDIKQRAIDLGMKFVTAGLLTKEEYARLHEIKTWGKADERTSTGPVTAAAPDPAEPAASPSLKSTATGIASSLANRAADSLANRVANSLAARTAAHTINLNKATSAELETLPGIGPKTAAEIIAARPLKDLKSLDALPGFGPKKIESLRELVSF